MHFLIDALAETKLPIREAEGRTADRFSPRTAAAAQRMLAKRGILMLKGGVVSLTVPMEQAHELIDCIRDHGITFGYPDRPRPVRTRGGAEQPEEPEAVAPKLRDAMYRAVILLGHHRLMIRATLVAALGETWGDELAAEAVGSLEERKLIRSVGGGKVALNKSARQAQEEVQRLRQAPPRTLTEAVAQTAAAGVVSAQQHSADGRTRIRLTMTVGAKLEIEGDAETVARHFSRFLELQQTQR
jgi:hypothetical protein